MDSPWPHSGSEACSSEELPVELLPDLHHPLNREDHGAQNWANLDHRLPFIEEETSSETSSFQSPGLPADPLQRYLKDVQAYELIALGLESQIELSPSDHHRHYHIEQPGANTSDSSSDTWSMAAEPGADLPMHPIERYTSTFEAHECLAVEMERDPDPPGEALSPPDSEGHSISLSSPSSGQSGPLSGHGPFLEADGEGEVEDYAVDVQSFLAAIRGRRRRAREGCSQYRVTRRRLSWEQRKRRAESSQGGRASP